MRRELRPATLFSKSAIPDKQDDSSLTKRLKEASILHYYYLFACTAASSIHCDILLYPSSFTNNMSGTAPKNEKFCRSHF